MLTIAQTLAILMLAQDGAAASALATTQPIPEKHQLQDFTDGAMRLLGPTFENTTLYGWAGLLASILLGVVAGRVASGLLLAAMSRLHKRGWQARGDICRHAAGPANLALVTIGLTLGIQLIYLTDSLRGVAGKIIALLLILSIAWFIYNLVALIDIVMRRMLKRSDPKLVETVVAMVRKALRIFLMVMVGLFVIQNIFEQNITAWLAGLGIAGLAVSLAAQDPIKNIFGSFTVLAERPFVLGDRIIFNHIDGTVEEIGFRSTRIRTTVGHLVTVPNMKFTDSIIENISRRPSIRRVLNLGVTYDTTPAKMREAVALVEGVMREADIAADLRLPEDPPRITFTDLNADNLNIQLTYWYAINQGGRDWWSYLKHGERVNLRIMEAFASAGIQFAFPTRTVHVINDAGGPSGVSPAQDARPQVD